MYECIEDRLESSWESQERPRSRSGTASRSAHAGSTWAKAQWIDRLDSLRTKVSGDFANTQKHLSLLSLSYVGKTPFILLFHHCKNSSDFLALVSDRFRTSSNLPLQLISRALQASLVDTSVYLSCSIRFISHNIKEAIHFEKRELFFLNSHKTTWNSFFWGKSLETFKLQFIESSYYKKINNNYCCIKP